MSSTTKPHERLFKITFYTTWRWTEGFFFIHMHVASIMNAKTIKPTKCTWIMDDLWFITLSLFILLYILNKNRIMFVHDFSENSLDEGSLHEWNRESNHFFKHDIYFSIFICISLLFIQKNIMFTNKNVIFPTRKFLGWKDFLDSLQWQRLANFWC